MLFNLEILPAQEGDCLLLHWNDKKKIKLAVIDGRVAFCGGINVLDDFYDPHYGTLDSPRFDFAVQVQGPLVLQVEQAARAMWSRAALGADWRDEVAALARGAEPLARARRVLAPAPLPPPPSCQLTSSVA